MNTTDGSPNSPYTLKVDGQEDLDYTKTIRAFTGDWLSESERLLARPIREFQEHQKRLGLEPRSPAELAFEMLVLGVLLREHGEQAVALPALPAWLLARLVEAQDHFPLPAVERPIKTMRGVVQGLAADPTQPGDPLERAFHEPAERLVGRLVDWLSAVGAGSQAERMSEWQAYLGELNDQADEALLARCLLLADEFAETSQAALGAFTQGVEGYVDDLQNGPGSRWRYDSALVTRTRVEYHLGMLGSEILTRAYRTRYEAMPRKIVIVPDCLCAHSLRMLEENGSSECQAKRTSLGGLCQGCTPGCRVHQLTRLGQKRGFEVYILPDDLRGVGVGTCSKLEGVGVVGVSCALTNWDAGWQVSGAGVPCQGVLLDYAGCRSHWHPNGRSTDVDLQRVVEAVGEPSRGEGLKP